MTTFAIAFGTFVLGLWCGFIVSALLFNSHKETTEADWDVGANDGR